MKFIKGFLFVLLFMLVGFVLAAWISSFTVAEGSGLAGGGIVFGSGLLGAIIGLVLGIIFLVRTNRLVVSILAIVSLAAFIVIGGLLGMRKSNAVGPSSQPKIPTKPVSYYVKQEVKSMGLGMASPILERETVYFYNPNLEKQVDEHLPYDSIAFQRTEQGIDISYAPSWFYPVHMKMDYGILLLRVESITKDWIQVEVNQQTGRKAWVSRADIKFQSWELFLLQINSVESIDPQDNPLRSRPLPHSSPSAVKGTLYVPIEIKDEWMKVKVYRDDYQLVGEGWIKWRSGNQLLVSYNLLS